MMLWMDLTTGSLRPVLNIATISLWLPCLLLNQRCFMNLMPGTSGKALSRSKHRHNLTFDKLVWTVPFDMTSCCSLMQLRHFHLIHFLWLHVLVHWLQSHQSGSNSLGCHQWTMLHLTWMYESFSLFYVDRW